MARKHRIIYNLVEGSGALRDASVVPRGDTPLRFAANKTGMYYRDAANNRNTGVILATQGVTTTATAA